MRLGKGEGGEFIPSIKKNMETFLTIFGLSIFIGIETVYRLRWNEFKKSQQAYNRFVLEMFEKQGKCNEEVIANFRITTTKIGEMDKRILNAGTKIIELTDAIILPTDKEIN